MTTDELAENTQRIEELLAAPVVGRSRRTKWLDRAKNLAAVVSFIALAGVLWNKSEQATAESQAARASQYTACVESNRVRAQVAQLWDYIIIESRKANPHPTAKQASDLAAFETKVTDIYAPRKC